MPNRALTAALLRSMLDYDPATGVFRWKVRPSNRVNVGDVAGSITKFEHGDRREIRLCGHLYRASRLAFLWMNGRWPKVLVDHKNCKPLDDRWKNLREANPLQNNANRRKYSHKTLPKGVKRLVRKSGDRYRAEIGLNYSIIHLGVFDSPTAAHRAYRHAAKRLHGEYARS